MNIIFGVVIAMSLISCGGDDSKVPSIIGDSGGSSHIGDANGGVKDPANAPVDKAENESVLAPVVDLVKDPAKEPIKEPVVPPLDRSVGVKVFNAALLDAKFSDSASEKTIAIQFRIDESRFDPLIKFNNSIIPNISIRKKLTHYEVDVNVGAISGKDVFIIGVPKVAIPNIHINTTGELPVNKEDYVKGGFSISNACAVNSALIEKLPCSDFDVTHGDFEFRLRGNSTLTLPKKPYRIKFKDKKSFYGRVKNKNWVLLADYNDLSKIKNYSAYKLADKVGGMTFSPLAVHVNLHVNGIYQGIYLLSDQVQENEGRSGVEGDIGDHDVEVPFLVELDEYAPQEGVAGIDYFSIENRHYAVKYPDVDARKNVAQFQYIENYVRSVNLAVEQGVGWESFLDLESFFGFYITQEMMGQADIDWKSVYMSKALGERLKMGPVWDFDWAAGGPVFMIADGIYQPYVGWYSKNNWFSMLLQHDGVKLLLKEKWASSQRGIDDLMGHLVGYKSYVESSVVADQALWGQYIYTDNEELNFNAQYAYVSDFLKKRRQWMGEAINAFNPQ